MGKVLSIVVLGVVSFTLGLNIGKVINQPVKIYIADFDKDGRKDVKVQSFFGDEVIFYQQVDGEYLTKDQMKARELIKNIINFKTLLLLFLCKF